MPIAFEPTQPRFSQPHGRSHAAAFGNHAARVRSSVLLGGLAVLMLTHALSPAPSGLGAGAVSPVVEPREVRMINSTPSLELPCEQQTWPYIHARCLTGGSAVAVRTVRPAADAPEFDPRNAVGPVAPPAREAANAAAANDAGAGIPPIAGTPLLRPFDEVEPPRRPRYFSPRVDIQ